ncbi:hypothetical protein ACOME3_003110 [Neoechinorhynchus agilis]
MKEVRNSIADLDSKRERLLRVFDEINNACFHERPHINVFGKLKVDQYRCPICISRVPASSMRDHINKCMNSNLDQEILSGDQQSEIPNLFCDIALTDGCYCKRMESQCSTHTNRSLRLSATTICGFPLNIDNVFDYIGDGSVFCCKLEKHSCPFHAGWEKRELIKIDADRLSYWIKLDELSIQQNLLSQSLTVAKNPLNSYGVTVQTLNQE